MDTIYWGLTPNGQFTVQSIYRALTSNSGSTQIDHFKWIWRVKVTPKIKSFLWLLMHARLPTRQYLHHIGIIPYNLCHLCGNESETINHIFLQCTNAQRLWHQLRLSHIVNTISRTSPPSQWLYPLFNNNKYPMPHKINQQTFMSFTLWNLWISRNDNNFNNRQQLTNPKHIINQALEYTYLASNMKIQYNNILLPLKWIPPKPNYYKLNTDGASSRATAKAGVGGLIRDSHGTWKIGFAGNILPTNSVHAELQALFIGLKLGNLNYFTPLEVNMDIGGINNSSKKQQPIC